MAAMKPNLLPLPAARDRWRQALRAARLPADRRWRYATEIHRFLRYCEILRVAPGRQSVRDYLSAMPLAIVRPESRQALRWFLQTARRPAPDRPEALPWWEEARAAPSRGGTWYAPDGDADEDGADAPGPVRKR